MSGCTRYAVNTETTDNKKKLPVIFTSNAAARVAAITENNPLLKLRLFIKSGGCSGLEYGFDLDEKVREGDFQTVTNGVTLLIDENSFSYLSGATLDFAEDIQKGESFIIDNPNAERTCGCGSSFDVKDI